MRMSHKHNAIISNGVAVHSSYICVCVSVRTDVAGHVVLV